MKLRYEGSFSLKRLDAMDRQPSLSIASFAAAFTRMLVISAMLVVQLFRRRPLPLDPSTFPSNISFYMDSCILVCPKYSAVASARDDLTSAGHHSCGSLIEQLC